MNSRCILFADDDVLTQWIMTEVLTEAGYDVVSACRGREAIELIDTHAEFDLLIVDMDLPDSLSGHDLAEIWRKTLPGRPVIFTGLKSGASMRLLDYHETFLEKPFSATKLLSAIEAALEDASFRPFLPGLSRRSHHVH